MEDSKKQFDPAHAAPPPPADQAETSLCHRPYKPSHAGTAAPAIQAETSQQHGAAEETRTVKQKLDAFGHYLREAYREKTWSELATRRRNFHGLGTIDRWATLAPQDHLDSEHSLNVDNLILTGGTYIAARTSRQPSFTTS